MRSFNEIINNYYALTEIRKDVIRDLISLFIVFRGPK